MSILDDIRVTHRRPSAALVGSVTAAVLAAVGGWWLGGATRSPAPVVAPDSVAAVGDLRLELETGWVAADAAPGPRVDGGQAYAPIPGLSARALLVTGAAADASLVPAALRGELPERLPAPRRATLGGLPAWSYGPFRAKRRVLEVTVVPTTSGVLALACSAPPASWSAALGCTEGVHAITSAKAKALEPAADLGFRLAAGPALRAFDERRVIVRRRLATAAGPGARAAAASTLAETHRAVADELAPLAAPGATAGVVAALRDAAGAYDAFATAARRDDRQPFIAARAAVTRGDAALASALRRLRG
jgi:hypothetical protein